MLKFYARDLVSQATNPEKKLWYHLKYNPIFRYRFYRQYIIGSYIVDFVCLEKRLIIEIDGSHHANHSQDIDRTQYLKSRGFAMLRFWNNDVLRNTNNVLERIYYELFR